MLTENFQYKDYLMNVEETTKPIVVGTTIKNSHRGQMEFKYQKIWYKLGSPIEFPFLKFIISIVVWIMENFFLIMNIVNAVWIREGSSPEMKRERIWIASLTIGLHITSCIIISFIDSLNKVAISGKAWNESKCFAAFRLVAHGTLTMKFLRYFSAYLENRKKNRKILQIHTQRLCISEEEIQLVVDIKKNDLVDCHYDIIEIFFKNIPAALLQVYLMFQTSLTVQLKLTTRIDIYRFLTVFFTIVSGAALTTNYQLSYSNYTKVLHFQDCFRINFRQNMNLNLNGVAVAIFVFLNHLISMAVRISLYSLVIFWSPYNFMIVLPILFFGEWLVLYVFSRTSWRFRPVLENPLYGVPWFSFELMDAWINLYTPGVHYFKLINHAFSIVVLNVVALFVFQGFPAIITPLGPNKVTLLDKKVPNYTNANILHSYGYFNSLLNCTHTPQSNLSLQETYAEDECFIGSILQILLYIHEYITLHEIPYVYVFYYIVKFTNVLSFFSLIHICVMNLHDKYDVDFPIQIAHDFYAKILSTPFNCEDAKKFILVNLLPTKDFFNLFQFCRNMTLKNMTDSTFQKLLLQIQPSSETSLNSIKEESEETDKEKNNSKKCLSKIKTKWVNIRLILAKLLFPEGLRIVELDWNVDTSKDAILQSVNNHILRHPIQNNLIHCTYEDADEQTKLLLAVFCRHFDAIMKQTSSYRIQNMFYFLERKVEKGSACCVTTTTESGVCNTGNNRPFWNAIVKDLIEI